MKILDKFSIRVFLQKRGKAGPRCYIGLIWELHVIFWHPMAYRYMCIYIYTPSLLAAAQPVAQSSGSALQICSGGGAADDEGGTMAEMWRSPQMVPRFVGFLSSLLQRVAETNDALSLHGGGATPPCHQKVTVFHGLSRPGITVASYLERIFTYANCSPSCYVVAYIYLDRFSRRQPLVAVTSLTVHRLLITSVMVAAKFMDDV